MINSKLIFKTLFVIGVFYYLTYYLNTFQEDFKWYDPANILLMSLFVIFKTVEIIKDYKMK